MGEKSSGLETQERARDRRQQNRIKKLKYKEEMKLGKK